MKRIESVLASTVLLLAGFVGIQFYNIPGTADTPAATFSVAGTLTGGLARASSSVAERGPTLFSMGRLSPAELRRRVSEGAEGTYINDLLAARDSALIRWPDRMSRPLRVWIQHSTLASWDDRFVPSVESAFDTWYDVGIPVSFTFIRDSASADVRVHFTQSMPNNISGKTIWSRDSRYWLMQGDIELALTRPNGDVLDSAQMRAITLHEVGHLLGLDHSEAPDHIMSARVRVRDLTSADRATMRLIYSVPAGSLKNGNSVVAMHR